MKQAVLVVLLSLGGAVAAYAQDSQTDAGRDILVTFNNTGAKAISAGVAAPYRNRKRYAIAANARAAARAVADEYGLLTVDHWPIDALDIYCFVYRVPPRDDRQAVVQRLRDDRRIESAQLLQHFTTQTGKARDYDDPYLRLQHSFRVMDVRAAHRHSRGAGVKVAVIDSYADVGHEDLRGRFNRITVFADSDREVDAEHGTAVASIIGANAENSKGIVGIAPEADIDLLVSCWAEPDSDQAVCNSFSLAKALDAVVKDPPDVLNMSLKGPHDPLLARLLDRIYAAGVIVVAAGAMDGRECFPADAAGVMAVVSSEGGVAMRADSQEHSEAGRALSAPGHQIVVALPDNIYDFRSGSSLASAHVTGVVALLLAVAPELSFDEIWTVLDQSQTTNAAGQVAINACMALQLVDSERSCIS